MRLHSIECVSKALIGNLDCTLGYIMRQPSARLVEAGLLDEANPLYCDKDHHNGKVPDKGESDETDDSGKPIPNPMPDDLDEPLQLKPHHQPHFGRDYILYTCL